MFEYKSDLAFLTLLPVAVLADVFWYLAEHNRPAWWIPTWLALALLVAGTAGIILRYRRDR